MAKKRKRLNVRKLFVFILFFYLCGYFGYTLFKMPIKNIIIDGTYYLKDYEIIEAAGIRNYPAMLSLNSKKVEDKIKSLSLVQDVKVSKNYKFQLKIKVVENKVVCIYNNNYLLEDGTSISMDTKYGGVPTLVNYTPEDILKDFLEGLGEIDYGIISGISEIVYSPSVNKNEEIIDDTRFILKMNDGNTVYINNSKISLLKRYQKIYASLDDQGILHLDGGGYLEVQ